MKPSQYTPSFIALAPMEGIVDHQLRYLLSAIGGIDRCVTEFIRITNRLLPERVFHRYFPELMTDSQTQSNTPVYAQLLGDNPELMADNALALANYGAKGIDINFGCPAKTVNNHGGGSFLLQYPAKVQSIVETIRLRVPSDVPVTAKIRLGYKDKALITDIAHAVNLGGADELAVHARTKTEGYKPPAHWHHIAEIRQLIDIPLTANGEIWTLDDLQRCMDVSQTDRIMIGRGLIACPDLALMARNGDDQPLHWGEICLLLLHYMELLNESCTEKYRNNLIKQWLVYLRFRYPQAYLFFESVKKLRASADMHEAIRKELSDQTAGRAFRLQLGGLDLTQTYHRL